MPLVHPLPKGIREHAAGLVCFQQETPASLGLHGAGPTGSRAPRSPEIFDDWLGKLAHSREFLRDPCGIRKGVPLQAGTPGPPLPPPRMEEPDCGHLPHRH